MLSAKELTRREFRRIVRSVDKANKRNFMAAMPGGSAFSNPKVSKKQQRYEYETERRPFDLLTGDSAIRIGLERGLSAGELENGWQEDLAQFCEVRRDLLIYPE